MDITEKEKNIILILKKKRKHDYYDMPDNSDEKNRYSCAAGRHVHRCVGAPTGQAHAR
jgi:hypothetical protein